MAVFGICFTVGLAVFVGIFARLIIKDMDKWGEY